MKVTITQVETSRCHKVAKIFRYLCFLTAVVFILDDILQVYLVNTNYFLHNYNEFLVEYQLKILVITRTIALCSSVSLIYGAIHKDQFYLALFLWTTLEMHVFYVILICYKSMENMIDPYERYLMWGILFVKACLWQIVNLYQNYLKKGVFV